MTLLTIYRNAIGNNCIKIMIFFCSFSQSTFMNLFFFDAEFFYFRNSPRENKDTTNVHRILNRNYCIYVFSKNFKCDSSISNYNILKEISRIGRNYYLFCMHL